MGGCRHPDSREVLNGDGAGGHNTLIRNVDDFSIHRDGAGWISLPFYIPNDGVASRKAGRRELGLTTIGYINGRGGNIVDGDVCHPPTEHSCTVHHKQTYYGSVYGGRAYTLGACVPEVLGTKYPGLGGDAGGFKDGGNGVDGGGLGWG